MAWLRKFRTELILVLIVGGFAFARWQHTLKPSDGVVPKGAAPKAAFGPEAESRAQSGGATAALEDQGASGDTSAVAEGSDISATPSSGSSSEKGPIDDSEEKLRVSREAACNSGDTERCQDLALWLVEKGKKSEAAAVLGKVCDREFEGSFETVEACADRGELLSPVEVAAAKIQCSTGNVRACVTYAASLPSEKKSEVKANLDKACAAGMTPACGMAGRLMTDREFDSAKASCSSGDSKACVNVAGFYGKSNREDEVVRFVTKACEQGLASSCLDLGDTVSELGDLAKKEAVARLERNCQRGSAPDCLTKAGFLSTVGNESEAQKLFERACSLGNSEACKIRDYVRKRRAPSR